MPKHRSYRLLCPIARALDMVGDRWSLLILRDLHAAPARFSDLFNGLEGLASNLLTTRLQQLTDDGLIEKRPGERGVFYALTDVGQRSAPLLFELMTFGSSFEPAADIRRPRNLRTVAVALKEALRRAVGDGDEAHVELVVDDEPFAIDVAQGVVSVRYEAYDDAAIRIAVDYDAMIAVADGRMPPSEYAEEHVRVERGTQAAAWQFMGLMASGFGG
jgi:DNA-binding HxlR family transcriptional regulator